MRPPDPKTWALAIALFLAAIGFCLLTGCDQKEPGHTINAGPTADDIELLAKRQNFVTKADHKEALSKEYWKGAKAQAISAAQLKPLFITEFRNGELLVFEVTDRFKDSSPIFEAEALIEATEKPFTKVVGELDQTGKPLKRK